MEPSQRRLLADRGKVDTTVVALSQRLLGLKLSFERPNNGLQPAAREVILGARRGSSRALAGSDWLPMAIKN